MDSKNKLLLDIGDLVEDNISGKMGIILEIKKWSYSIDLRDVYVHWSDGEKFWIISDDLDVISKTHGVHNHVLKDKSNLVITISPNTKDND
jgi:hypothetical protein